MDHWQWPASGYCRRFPRPRGDGPSTRGRGLAVVEVSPPTRGWTHKPLARKLDHPGFPAHAGMDLCPRHSVIPSAWFPRPRGDGPWIRYGRARATAVSPPTRGWTPTALAPLQVRQGFPAHAGMDLTSLTGLGERIGFPRPRGDGPARCPSRNNSDPVSPPTRGWTPIRSTCSSCRSGFPAHAGMDLQPADERLAGGGFPRPRGDGPADKVGELETALVSPPTRGWTVGSALRPGGAGGFPAHAGMDLQPADKRLAGGGFPRPRGDGPLTPWPTMLTRRVSPPTRGWTPWRHRPRRPR